VRVFRDRTKVFVPTHYVARERLCLSATADDWSNAMDGKRFIGVSRAVDPALLQCSSAIIVPRLEADIPNEPGAEQRR
jgi:hypothetical protein